MARTRGIDGHNLVLDAAARLFYADGIEAVSVDQVASAAGLTKRAIYYHFPSKRDLVLAYLERADDPALALLKSFARTRDASNCHPYAAVLNGLGRWLRSGKFHGCAFLNAVRALPDDPSVASIAITHKDRTRDWLAEVAAAEGHSRPRQAAGHFLLVLDSVLSTGHLYETDDLLERAHAALSSILEDPCLSCDFERPLQ
jgi:AcrR family transcriptional regulator